MKAIDIALKDMLRSFRSAFSLVFMFAIPLLVTGMFFVMFGGMKQDAGFSLPVTKVALANLDQATPEYTAHMAQSPLGAPQGPLGDVLAALLQDEALSDLVEVQQYAGADAARQAVDLQEAAVAVIIPEDFSTRFAGLEGQAVLELYQDPTLTVGPGVVRAILEQYLDGISGAKIAALAAVSFSQARGEALDPAFIAQVASQYVASQHLGQRSQGDASNALLEVRTLDNPGADKAPMMGILTPIMGGMLVFYAFYTGTVTAQTILKEEEERTLPRLFTTPTPQHVILTGKFLAVFLTVTVQVVVLLGLARLLFDIRWGEPLAVAVMAAGAILMASTFGIFLNSLLKDTRQGGILYGGVLTMTGMLGMVRIFTLSAPDSAPLINSASLLVPQGWAVRSLLQAAAGEPVALLLPGAVAMLAWSLVFFTTGVWRFHHRYA